MTQGLQPTTTSTISRTSQQQLRPPAAVGSETALAPEAVESQAARAALPSDAPQLVSETQPVAFLPVTGAPQSTVASLATSMRRAALSQSVPVVVSVNQGAQYQLKGYFSALNDSGGTLLVYVWDVLDRNGTRIHRISGQERAQLPSNGDPWAAIDSNLIDKVAQETMSSLRTWMRTRTG